MKEVGLPIVERTTVEGVVRGSWWHRAEDRIVCDLCPRECALKENDRGFCFVRQNRNGEMVLTTYGRSTGFCIDPIEKKPLYHFFPGTSVLSFGTAGCNLGCKFCQNHDISKARKVELLSEHASPETIASAAQQLGCNSVAYTYNDPIVWAEYAIDTAKACRQLGINSVAVTAGYISPAARAPFFEFFDAANVDLKAFTEEFYQQLTLSHLQPVLDTLVWLQRETDVWFEITNLVIPGANDSADELGRLCDWVLTHLGDEVPIHFSAFHPDFRMQDRPRTPHETLLSAHETARNAGLKYVYIGNVHDAQRQSTYCQSCGELVIQRDWYQLGQYLLQNSRCDRCGYALPGRFSDQPGDWGRKRQPVRIGQFAEQGTATTRQVATPNVVRRQELDVVGGKSPSEEQLNAVHRAACELVLAAATGGEDNLSDPTMAGLAQEQVMGIYVSLKRKGRLRGCCGFTGRSTTIAEGLKFSAARTTNEDPRLPAVSSSELAFLDLEVWLLQEPTPIRAVGAARKESIQIGRDGLILAKGNNRGLLLPGVATDHNYDAEAFLRQVSVKAKLPPTAWRDPDTTLQRFEGTAAKGEFCPDVASRATQPATVVDEQAGGQLLSMCRENIELLARRAVPNYYVSDTVDGMVHGLVLSATNRAGQQLHVPKISLRLPLPVQSTLFALCETMDRQLRSRGLGPDDIRLDLAVFEDPAMHGTTAAPDLRGMDPTRRCLLMMGSGLSAWRFDPKQPAEEILSHLSTDSEMRPDHIANLYSFRTHASSPMQVINAVTPQTGPEVRPPAVAGRFYPATAGALASMVRSLVPSGDALPKRARWRAAMVPHAGLRYSGRLAADVLARIEIPKTVIVLSPKHTSHGVDWAVAPHKTWSLPGIEMPNGLGVADSLVDHIDFLQPDCAAHAKEHGIEVEIPFLHHFAPATQVVGVVVGSGDLDACKTFARGLAEVVRELREDLLLLISSDMNHFATDVETRRLDEIALQALESRDPDTLFRTVREHEISMCGVLPAVIAMSALHQIQPLTKVERVGYATSGDVTGDVSRVVGYAGLLMD